MTASLSRAELENLKPKLDKAVYKIAGYSDHKLLSAVLDYVTQGYDQKKMTAKLGSLLDSRKASKLATQVSSILMTNNMQQESGKKKHNGHDEYEKTKKRRSDLEEKDVDGDIYKEDNPTASLLTDTQIKDMMANAQKVIQERKRALNVGPVDIRKPTAETEAIEIDKQRKIQQLQAQIQSKIASGMLKTFAPSRPTAADKPTPLILDVDGKTVDVTGKEIQLSHVTPTLKANIRARKREVFKTQLNEKPAEEEQLAYFDSRIPMKTNVRNKRSLKFHEPGKFLQIAERMRMKAQLEKLQSEISLIAKKTGISSAAKLARMAPKEDREVEEVPTVEWWDSVILNDDSYDRVGIDDDVINLEAITNLVEHPTQMKPPSEPLIPVYMPVFLTKAERKKLRRQNRREAWKEEQEKIRLGLEAPPEPKMRISNLMRVLGTEAVQDPTKIEAHVRAQMAKRQKAHEEANASRKLTAEQKREKKIKKISEDTSLGVYVAIYRVSDLTNPSKKFKVEVNAKQLLMTGGVFIFRNCNLVVVEGGQKQQNKFKRLMLKRIKWEEDVIKNVDGTGGETNNKCVLVWEGTTKQRNFGEMKFRVCANEKIAREQLKKHGVEHYWDLAYSTSILDEK